MKVIFAIFQLVGSVNNVVLSMPIRDKNRNESIMEFESYADAENYIKEIIVPEFNLER
jgi:hypothetical protein